MTLRGTVLAAAALAAAAFASGGASAADPRRGAATAELCANCHGADGVSRTPGVPSLAGMPAEFITLQMILFREGLRNAPPMPDVARGLSDAEIEDLAAWYASLPPGTPEDLSPPDPARLAEGESLSARLHCGVCHLPDYRGRAQIPRLAGQREEYLVHALTQYRDNARVGTDTQMNAVTYGLPDSAVATLAHYLAHRR